MRLQSAPLKVAEMSLLIGEAPELSLLIPEGLLVSLHVCQLLAVSSCTSSVADVFAHDQYDQELCATKADLLGHHHQQCPELSVHSGRSKNCDTVSEILAGIRWPYT